jgi:formate dehydrogenase iron-sulfur subunit
MIGILVDVTKCTGCSQCVHACVEANQLGPDVPSTQKTTDGLSADRWLAITRSPEGQPVRKSCRHCLEPACVSVCPVGAMYRTAEGAVIYDASRCMGCRYCMMACPFGIPRYEWDSAAPKVQKCTLCYQRLQNRQQPACVEACPSQALTFGDRDTLLKIAHSAIQKAPQLYQPVVYGEYEAGGAALLYLSNIPLNFLNVHGSVDDEPWPEFTWNWLSKVPGLSLATAGLMTGLFWIIGRRIQAEEARQARSSQPLRSTDDL